MDRNIPKLNHFIQSLSEELTAKVWPNVYITPASAQALAPHFDTHDVFVLQIYGTKAWKLYDSPVDLPDESFIHKQLRGEVYEKKAVEFSLQQGDLLYIPRGLVHEAVTSKSTSIHISIGIKSIRNIDLVNQILKEALKNPFFRKTTDLLYNRSSSSVEEQEQFFKEALIEEIKKADFNDILENAKQQIIRDQDSKNYNNLFSSLVYKNDLTIESKVKKRSEVRCTLKKETPILKLHFDDKTQEFPPFLNVLLERAVSGETFKIKDLDDKMKPKDILKFVKMLTESGVLEVIEI